MMLLFLACRAEEPCVSGHAEDAAEADAWSYDGFLATEDGEKVHVQLRRPGRPPEDGEAWPVSVVVQGGWDHEGTPVEADGTTVGVADGMVAIHLDLPGAGGSTGIVDRRGALARAAVATVLRYAAGRTRDDEGCAVTDRAEGAVPDDLYVVGASNGGNLAAATLADPTLELPPIAGMVAWESPAAPAFATVGFGVEPNVYEPGSCALDAGLGITCDFPTELVAWGPEEELCFDVDASGSCTGEDIVVHGVEDPASGLRMVDPPLVAAAIGNGHTPAGYAGVAEAEAWWAERDAARAARIVAEAWPDLAIVLLASEEDHILPYSDHPHVFGLYEALRRAGVRWVRLNPGPEWSRDDAVDNPPNAEFSLAEPTGALLAEDEDTALRRTFSAAIDELSTRRAIGDW